MIYRNYIPINMSSLTFQWHSGSQQWTVHRYQRPHHVFVVPGLSYGQGIEIGTQSFLFILDQVQPSSCCADASIKWYLQVKNTEIPIERANLNK